MSKRQFKKKQKQILRKKERATEIKRQLRYEIETLRNIIKDINRDLTDLDKELFRAEWGLN